MTNYYDRRTEPMTRDEWVRAYTPQEQRVELEERDGVRVSTVWLGLDHQYGLGPPLIFETMIFGGEYDGEQWRYTTEGDARRGHKKAVELVFGVGSIGHPQ